MNRSCAPGGEWMNPGQGGRLTIHVHPLGLLVLVAAIVLLVRGVRR